jgi:hypothetical protein
MVDIPEHIKKFFFEAKKIGECSLIAYYINNSQYTFIYEKDGVPNIFNCNEKMDNRKSATIPYTLPDLMERMSKLDKENKILQEKIKTLMAK